MAQTGYTPIQLYNSSTASAAPIAGNLAAGELAINTADGKLFYKDSGGVVQVIASKAGANGDVVGPASATNNNLAAFDGVTGKLIKQAATVTVAQGGTGLASGTSGGVPYFSSTSAITSSAALAANALVVGGGAGAAPSTVTTGTGVVTALGVNTGTAGAFVVNGGALGTPSSGDLTNATALPVSTGISGLGTGVATFLGTPSSANLAAAVTDETGSGSLVFATSPSLTTPSLGVATATSINKVAFTAPATSATVTIADGKTFTLNNTLTLSGTDSTTMTFPTTSATIARTDAAQTFTGTQTFGGSVVPATNVVDSVGYTGMPQNSQSANYTLVAGDAGDSIVHPITDNNARTFTIPANGSVAFPVGTTITFVNMINTVTIAITTDTMYLAGVGTTGSRTLAAYGIATAIKVTSTSWIISGNGLT
jgi:hypothetical protein